MLLSLSAAALDAANASSVIRFDDLGLSAVALDLGFFTIKWYSLAYLAGIILGYWYLSRLIKQPGAPMAQRHADDFILYATLGIILGGRIGYVLFYQPSLLDNPLDALKLWEGGMSFHGGLLGTVIGIALLCRKEKLEFLRVCDYVACVVPFGLLFGRFANFVNGELWGRATDGTWGIIFDGIYGGGDLPRHPSQLYEAASEGLLLAIILALVFWFTKARWRPGLLVGIFTLGYGLSRFTVEYFREPDEQLQEFAMATGFSMGQWLTMPMIALGLGLIIVALVRKPVNGATVD